MDEAYDGNVESGGPPAARRVHTRDGTVAQITKLSVGTMDNNVYALRVLDGSGPETDVPDTILIDAADEPGRILEALGDARVGAIVTTHRHADHWQALGAVVDATRAPVLAGTDDAEAIGHPIDRRLADGDEVRVGPLVLSVLHTPGHTPGSVCLDLETRGDVAHHLFTGDTLFPGGPGNTFGDAAAFQRIMGSLRSRVFALPDATWVYPGHGDDTTLAQERPHLESWAARGW